QSPVVDPAAGTPWAGPLPAASADRAGRPGRSRAARPRGDVQAVRLLSDRVERAQRGPGALVSPARGPGPPVPDPGERVSAPQRAESRLLRRDPAQARSGRATRTR